MQSAKNIFHVSSQSFVTGLPADLIYAS